ncbi:MAG: secretin N-terminal domain-containing protein [Fimbriimonas sp.]
MASKRVLMMGVLLVPVLALGQFDFGGGPGRGPDKKPWEELALNPKTRIKLAFRNASIDSIISLFERTSKTTIVKDPTLTGGLTVTSAQPVTLAQAFQILSTTLSLKGYELVREEKLLVIRKKDQNNRANSNPPPFDWTQFQNPGQQEPKLRVIPIIHANASQLARVINEVFAGQGGGFSGFPGGGGGFPGGGGGRFGNQGGRGGQGGNNPFLQQMMARMGQQNNTVRASADDFSNSVIVNGPENMIAQVEKLVKDLDKQTEEPQKSRVFKLEFADADEILPVIQNVLTANIPRGRGGATTQQSQGPQAFFNAIRGNVAGSGNVTSDPRTNSIIVTATDQNLALVEKVVDELDTEVKYEPSTFVFPLANARADSVATLIQSAFGQRQGVGNFGGNRGGTGTTGNRNNQNRNNRNRNNQNRGGLGGEVVNPDGTSPAELAINLQDPNAEEGDLMTNIGVTQGFGQGFFGGGQGNRRTNAQNQQTQGRDANGRLVNVRDLTGQVTAIPDPNTNSIIVVTTPENADLIRNILDQLDKIPEQVMIETIIVEATLDSTSRLGVEWKFANERLFNSNTTGTGQTDFGQQTNPPQQGFRYTLSGTNMNVFLNAFKNDSKFQVLSTPRIFTSNNVEAQINISQSVPYVLNSRQDVNGNFTFNYGFEDVGIVLTVTPRITSNGYVTMDVSQTANDLQGYTDFNAPIINQRQADTTVSVRDGETIVLGGIIRSTVNASTRKVPILGDLPLLGNLFRSTSKQKQKTELLVFLTPRVVRDPTEAQRLREEQQNQLNPENRKTIDDLIKPKGEIKPPVDNKNGGEPKKNGG